MEVNGDHNMKLTKQTLRKMIKEELLKEETLNEGRPFREWQDHRQNLNKLFKKKLSMVKNLNIDLSKRPEELSNEMFYKIAIQYEKLFD